jgi:thymidylate synthase/dihydrofolate reductase
MFNIITQQDIKNGTSRNANIPWLSNDCFINSILEETLKFFKSNSVVVVEPRFWEYISKRPLAKNIYFVCDVELKNSDHAKDSDQFKDSEYNTDPNKIASLLETNILNKNVIKPVVFTYKSLDTVLHILNIKQIRVHLDNYERFIVNSNNLIEQAINLGIVKDIYKFTIHKSFLCDETLALDLDNTSLLFQQIINNEPNLTILSHYKIINKDENNFTEILNNLIKSSSNCLYNQNISFDLRNNKFPIFTVNQFNFKNIFLELKWMLLGCTDINWLREKNVLSYEAELQLSLSKSSDKDANPTNVKKYPNDAGITSGFQMRHYRCKYVDYLTDYNGCGVDQLENCVQDLKSGKISSYITLENPYSIYHFFINEYGLNLKFMTETMTATNCMTKITQLGLFLYMIAKTCNCNVGFLHISPTLFNIDDNQKPLFHTLITRSSFPFPIIKIASPSNGNILNYTMNDVSLLCYEHHDYLEKIEEKTIVGRLFDNIVHQLVDEEQKKEKKKTKRH